jgi:hypothetical protein
MQVGAERRELFCKRACPQFVKDMTTMKVAIEHAWLS